MEATNVTTTDMEGTKENPTTDTTSLHLHHVVTTHHQTMAPNIIMDTLPHKDLGMGFNTEFHHHQTM